MVQMLDRIPSRQADAPARLRVDRAFTMAGFGTIVTGTLWSGRIAVGDTLEVLPQGKQVRVRGVQSHGESVAAGIAGSRVAANLTGIEKKEITRGNVVCAPGVFKPTNLMDVRIRLLADAPVLPHLARIRLYLGSDEAIGRLSLLDRPRLDAGGSAVAQVRLETSIVAVIRGHLFHRKTFDAVAGAIRREVDAFHNAQPWRVGIPKEDLKLKAFGSGDNRLYAHVLAEVVATGSVEETGEFVRRPGYAPVSSQQELTIREHIVHMLSEGRFAPPAREELAEGAGDGVAFDRMFRALRDEGTIIEIAPGIAFHRDVLEDIKAVVAAEIAAHGNITVAGLRDRLGTSRKYALTVLEYFDSIKVTRRIDDARVLIDRTVAAKKET